MEVKFKCSKDSSASITIEKEEDGILIQGQELDPKSSLLINTFVYLDKLQLRDFIGQLLHIQSKLNR